MLVARQRVTQEDRVRGVGIERAIGFIRDFNRRKVAPAIERQWPGQSDFAIEAEALVVGHDVKKREGRIVNQRGVRAV